MHTGEHVLLAAIRRVLGKHVWQHGTQKDVYESRFDIAHFRPLSREEIKKIEKEAMRIITANIDVEAKFMSRREAEDKYGFVLYEGGIPPGKEIRVVKINGFDVEACGGTHVRKTGEIGFLKILRTERIQDGVSRVIYTAGLSALEKVQEMEDFTLESSKLLSSSPEKLPNKIESIIEEWKSSRKEVEKMKEEKVKIIAESIMRNAKDGKLVAKVDMNRGEMQKLMKILSEKLEKVILINDEGALMVHSVGGDAAEIAKEITKSAGGKAGGRGNFAQGRIESAKVSNGINIAKTLMGFE